MTALLVSVVRADSPAHFTWDSRKYSSAFLVMRAMCSRKLFQKLAQRFGKQQMQPGDFILNPTPMHIYRVGNAAFGEVGILQLQIA